mmetsp:Transcript_41495/g.97521  ORF Transcript_41495/g.97521 Transcript_41495/m.97521 type:complete len:263 (+) Transcript_41495:108-896(+)
MSYDMYLKPGYGSASTSNNSSRAPSARVSPTKGETAGGPSGAGGAACSPVPTSPLLAAKERLLRAQLEAEAAARDCAEERAHFVQSNLTTLSSAAASPRSARRREGREGSVAAAAAGKQWQRTPASAHSAARSTSGAMHLPYAREAVGVLPSVSLLDMLASVSDPPASVVDGCVTSVPDSTPSPPRRSRARSHTPEPMLRALSLKQLGSPSPGAGESGDDGWGQPPVAHSAAAASARARAQAACGGRRWRQRRRRRRRRQGR